MNVSFLSRPEDRSNVLEGTDHFVFTLATVVNGICFNYHNMGPEDRSIFFEGMEDPLVCITESANKAFATSQLIDVCWFARIQ